MAFESSATRSAHTKMYCYYALTWAHSNNTSQSVGNILQSQSVGNIISMLSMTSAVNHIHLTMYQLPFTRITCTGAKTLLLWSKQHVWDKVSACLAAFHVKRPQVFLSSWAHHPTPYIAYQRKIDLRILTPISCDVKLCCNHDEQQ